MVRRRLALRFLNLMLCSACVAAAQTGYPGFDRNVYPGDAALPALRKTFEYTSYWLNTPPGASANTWVGKRAILKQNGFGFLVLFNGRLEAALNGRNAAALGAKDGKAAAAAAAREGFAPHVLIFLDQEEGGRLTQPQAQYLFAWVDAVRAAGDRAGVYCSGITLTDESGPISTVQDIAQLEGARRKKAGRDLGRLALWIANDQCPPSPGCTVKPPPMGPAAFSPPGRGIRPGMAVRAVAAAERVQWGVSEECGAGWQLLRAGIATGTEQLYRSERGRFG